MDQVSAEMTRSEQYVKKFKLCKLIALSVLVAFLLGGLILFKNDITLENLRYLIKYLDFSSTGDFDEETQIYYNADSSNQFLVFRGDFALVNDSGVTLYDRRGSAVMTDDFNMTNPVPVCGERYLSVYDLGGYQVRIYNSFSLLFEKNFDYPIQAVSINGDGSFCVATSEKSYHSAVFVYDRDFEEVHHWFSADKFVSDVHLSDNDILTVSAVRASEGNLIGEVLSFEMGKEGARYTYSYSDQLPLSMSVNGDRVLLLTDENIINIEKGEEVGITAFSDNSLEQIRLGDDFCLVVQDELSVGVNYLLRMFDSEGKEVLSREFSVQVRDIEVYEDRAYVLTHTHLYVIRADGETLEYALDGDYSDFGVLSEDVVILCSDVNARIRILNQEGDLG